LYRSSLFPAALALALAAAAVFAACENPWIKRIAGDGDEKAAVPAVSPPAVTPPSVLTSAGDIEAWIASAVGKDPLAGNDAGHAIALPLAIDLSGSGWAEILQAVADADKYVELDLSLCGMGGVTPSEEFDPDNTTATGKDMIVSLVLPDAATSTKSGFHWEDRAFQNFTSLTSVSGGGIITVGRNTFRNTPLTKVSFPEATFIDGLAFYDCHSLTTVDLPKAAYIGQSVFQSCTSLVTVDLPSATSVDAQAFAGCTSLITANLPEVTSMGQRIFGTCIALETVNLSKVSSFVGDTFNNTGGQALTITLGAVPPVVTGTVFINVAVSKAVTVRVPVDASGYGIIPGTYSGADTSPNWGNAFRGLGWDGTSYGSSVNSYITLTIEEYTP
jgi:hypothetical protein